MVAVFGDITAQDDYTHALGPESNFNESMYFNFFDRKRNSGGFLRLGNRANEGYAEMTLTLYMPDGSVFNGQQNILPDDYFKSLKVGDPLNNNEWNRLIWHK